MKKKQAESKKTTTRREMIKKGSYVVPAVITLAVKPSFASAASGTGGATDPNRRRPTDRGFGSQPPPFAVSWGSSALATLDVSVLGWPVRVECSDPGVFRLVEGLYGHLTVATAPAQQSFVIAREDELSWLDDQLTIGAQQRRPDLLFLHAAGLVRAGRELVLAA